MPDAPPILTATQLHRRFRMGEQVIDVLRGCDLHLRRGEFVAIEGRSGSGKSTLLHLLGCLDLPDEGRIVFHDDRGETDLTRLPDAQRASFRNRVFGFVFQFYHLLPELNVLENTLLGAYVRHGALQWLGVGSEARRRACALLEQMGLGHRLRHRPAQLSGGERQRVAIARALMNRPQVLFADEPTGNLDDETGDQIMGVLNALHAAGQTLVMVTHDRTLARQADRVLLLQHARLMPAPAGDGRASDTLPTAHASAGTADVSPAAT